jgi:NAD(P)-dependent dehydrogenase (short-subunit alcohol dehydrogenase family)
MASLLVIGASQGIGLETVKCALAGGHDVRAFARGAAGIAIDDAKLTKITGDALDATAVSAAVTGADAVIQALGAPKTALAVVAGTTRPCDAHSYRWQPPACRLVAVTGICRRHCGTAAFTMPDVPPC